MGILSPFAVLLVILVMLIVLSSALSMSCMGFVVVNVETNLRAAFICGSTSIDFHIFISSLIIFLCLFVIVGQT